jgi:phosphate transport system substrate-binding protein
MKNVIKSIGLSLVVSWLSVAQLTAQTNEVLAKDAPIQVGEKSKPISGKQKVVIVTGARFSYPLVQKWIDEYSLVNPNVQVIIEARGSNDPLQYDVLAEVFEPSEEAQKSREYLYIARYAILPIANAQSNFAREYVEKGLNQDLIKQIYFHDIFADKENQKTIKSPYTVYTRLQKAGAPIVFTNYFGYEQKDIKGKAIAGSDEHLLKAILRDTLGVSYLPLSLIYDINTQKAVNGLAVLPIDLNGNGKVSTEEKFYTDLPTVLQNLAEKTVKNRQNLPISYLHLSVDKQKAHPEALKFLQWVAENGGNYLAKYGYLQPEAGKLDKEKIAQLAEKLNKAQN